MNIGIVNGKSRAYTIHALAGAIDQYWINVTVLRKFELMTTFLPQRYDKISGDSMDYIWNLMELGAPRGKTIESAIKLLGFLRAYLSNVKIGNIPIGDRLTRELLYLFWVEGYQPPEADIKNIT